MSTRLHPETRAALARLAEADKRRLSAYIAVVLERHVEEQERSK